MIDYLESKKLPEDEKNAKRVLVDSPHFELIDGVLYRENHILQVVGV